MTVANRSSVTLQDIADALGLAKGTVSMALRQDPRIAEKTIARVTKTASAMGYDPTANQAARRLSAGRVGRHVRNRVVGLVVDRSFTQVPYFHEQFCGVHDGLSDAGYASLVVSNQNHMDELPERLEPLTRGEIDGLVSLSSPSVMEWIAELRKRAGFGDRPMVSLIHELESAHSVLADDLAGAYASMAHLLALGHRYAVHVRSRSPYSEAENSVLRRQQYRKAMQDHGLDPDRHCLTCACAGGWMDPATAVQNLNAAKMSEADEELLHFFKAHPEVTAVLCHNDAIALNVHRALRLGGIDVPGRVSLVGFDDTESIPGPDGKNILSSVRVPLREIGRQGAVTVISAIEGRAVEAVLKLPTEFKERASSAPPSR